jgi:hypothetical protein
MSQDLFEAFGVPQGSSGGALNTSSETNQGHFSLNDFSAQEDFGQITSAISSGRPDAVIEEDDDWGEFEGAVEVTNVAQQSTKPVAAASYSRHRYDLADLGPTKLKQSVLSSTDVDPLSLKSGKISKISEEQDTNRVQKDPNILFDASDEASQDGNLDDFDDFGDFEQPEPSSHTAVPIAVKKQQAEIDLLGLSDESVLQSLHATKTSKTHQLKPEHSVTRKETEATHKLEIDLLGLGDSMPTQMALASGENNPKSFKFGQTTVFKAHEKENRDKSNSPLQGSPRDESWDDFSAWDEDSSEQTKKPAQEAKSIPFHGGRSGGMALPLLKGSSDTSKIDHPPTTIPPPALILSLFPSIFDLVDKELLQVLSAQSADVRKEVLSDPKTINYLRGYLAILVVCAHIIAGRKLRWKRDTILAQSMRIGIASSSRLSGMKVTSIDKSEVSREDREVAEVLRIWNSQVGKLRTVVAEAKKASGDQLPNIPELRETMPVKVASELEGGVSSVKGCALCGLKRAERVGKVDLEVEDSFGEWWVDQVIMHRGISLVRRKIHHTDYLVACRNFWAEHEASLRQR